jgi:hypothetical protein
VARGEREGREVGGEGVGGCCGGADLAKRTRIEEGCILCILIDGFCFVFISTMGARAVLDI